METAILELYKQTVDKCTKLMNENNFITVRFSRIPEGGIFILENKLFIKTNKQLQINCVRLNMSANYNGMFHFIPEHTECIVYNEDEMNESLECTKQFKITF